MSNTFLTAELTSWLPRCVLRPGKVSPVDPRCRSRSIPPGPSSPSSPEPAPPQDADIFATKSLQFPIDAQQTEILACPPERSRRIIVCCSRQWGKSTTGAIKVLHHALLNPGSLTLIASRTLRQAGELLEKVTGFAQTLGIPIRRAPRYADSLLFPNQSRVIALPGKPDSLRCFSAVSLLIVDEAAYVRDELYHALRPMLATTDGSIWLLSTPNGRSGFFYDEWSATDTTWTKFSVKAAECPRISPAFLAEERKLHGPAFFHREYECDFGYTGQSFFNLDDLDSAAGPERFHAAEEFAMGRPTTRFYVGFDLGQKDSYSAVVVIELIRGATDRRNPVTWDRIMETHLIFRRIERFPMNTPYDSQVLMLNRILRDLGDLRSTTLLVDATGCGQPFLEILRQQRMGVLISPIAITSSGTGSFSHGIERVPKKALMTNANYVLASASLTAESGLAGLKELREEMEAYRVRTSRSGNDSFRSSQHDDLVMAFALGVWKVRAALPKPGEPR